MIEIRREASHDSSVDQVGGEEESYDHSRIDVDNEEDEDGPVDSNQEQISLRFENTYQKVSSLIHEFHFRRGRGD